MKAMPLKYLQRFSRKGPEITIQLFEVRHSGKIAKYCRDNPRIDTNAPGITTNIF